jgi:hypothetical protein
MKPPVILIALVLGATGAGALAAGSAKGPQGRVSYICENKRTATVVYAGDRATIVGDRRGQVLLVRRKNAEGFLYESPSEEIRASADGKTITYTLGKVPATHCKATGK